MIKTKDEYPNKTVGCPICKKKVKPNDFLHNRQMCKDCHLTLLKMRSGA